MNGLTPLCLAVVLAAAHPPTSRSEVLNLPTKGKMRYALSIPPEYNPENPAPLVLALHYAWGGGAVPRNYGRDYMRLLVEPALSELGAVIAAPDCPGRSWIEPESEQALLTLVAQIQSDYSIAHDQILVTGFSLGGIGTWYLAARHPALFRAAVPMAGRPLPAWVDEIEEVPLFIIHSRQDEVVPIEATQRAMTSLRLRGVPVELITVDGIGHYETARYVPYLRQAVPWLQELLKGE